MIACAIITSALVSIDAFGEVAEPVLVMILAVILVRERVNWCLSRLHCIHNLEVAILWVTNDHILFQAAV